MPLKIVHKNHPFLIRLFILSIAFVIAFAANLYLPSLPALGAHFGSSAEDMELSVTFFILGFGVTQIIYGPLSDRLGRRKILFGGFLLGLAGSILCLKATSVTEFIFARFILGCGVCVGSALSRSLYRDTFSGVTLVKVVSQNGAIASIAPVTAPLIGGYINQWFGFQMNLLIVTIFIAIILVVIAVFLVETNKELNPNALHPKHIIKNYVAVASNRVFVGNMLCAGFCLAGTSAFLTVSPFLFQETLHLSIVEYGWMTAIVVSAMIIGRVLNSILLAWYTPHQNMILGITLMLFSGFIMLIPGLLNILNVVVIIIPVFIFVTGSSFVMTLAYAQSLEPFPRLAGSAGALYGSLMSLISFITSAGVAIIKSHNQNLLAITYIILSISILLSFQLTRAPSPAVVVAE